MAAPRTVVVAEDEALIRMDLVEVLREEGYDVVGEAADGQAAVDLVRALRPDVALLDVAMPRRDGLSAAEEIDGERLAAVVMVTAFSQRDTVERATAAGVHGYLVKPWGRADLGPAIEVAVARWEQLLGLEESVRVLRQRAQDRDRVDQAKRLLQAQGMSESEAFVSLRKAAMDRRLTLAEVAALVVAEGAAEGVVAESGPH